MQNLKTESFIQAEIQKLHLDRPYGPLKATQPGDLENARLSFFIIIGYLSMSLELWAIFTLSLGLHARPCNVIFIKQSLKLQYQTALIQKETARAKVASLSQF